MSSQNKCTDTTRPKVGDCGTVGKSNLVRAFFCMGEGNLSTNFAYGKYCECMRMKTDISGTSNLDELRTAQTKQDHFVSRVFFPFLSFFVVYETGTK